MDKETTQKTAQGHEAAAHRKSRLSIEHLWLLAPVLPVVWMGLLNPLRLLDFWWHLKAGQVIVSSRSIPQVDLFSFTRAGQPFVLQNWLGEVLYHLTYRIGGLELLITFNATLLLLALLPVYRLCLRAGPTRRASLLSAFVAALGLGLYSHVRPQVYSFVFVSAFYCILWEYREGRSDRLWALPLLTALWVNLHGAFVLGLAMLAVLWAGEVLYRVARPASPDALSPAALAKLSGILLLSFLATGLNPQGFAVYRYVRQLQIDPASQRFVTEWQVPDVKTLTGWLLFFGPFFLLLLAFFYSGLPPSWPELCLFVTFAILGLAANRNGIWFDLLAAPMVARRVGRFRLPNIRCLLRAPASKGSGTRQRADIAWLNWAIVACLLFVTVLLSPWVRPHLKVERLPSLLDPATPVGAMDFIAQRGLQGHIFHPQMYGDYLIWRLWPQQRSFIDGRVHLFDESLVQDYIIVFHDPNWETRLEKYDIQYLLLPKQDENAQSMIEDARRSASWATLYEDQISVLFQKQP